LFPLQEKLKEKNMQKKERKTIGIIRRKKNFEPMKFIPTMLNSDA